MGSGLSHGPCPPGGLDPSRVVMEGILQHQGTTSEFAFAPSFSRFCSWIWPICQCRGQFLALRLPSSKALLTSPPFVGLGDIYGAALIMMGGSAVQLGAVYVPQWLVASVEKVFLITISSSCTVYFLRWCCNKLCGSNNSTMLHTMATAGLELSTSCAESTGSCLLS